MKTRHGNTTVREQVGIIGSSSKKESDDENERRDAMSLVNHKINHLNAFQARFEDREKGKN
jgi:hypothetical protein